MPADEPLRRPRDRLADRGRRAVYRLAQAARARRARRARGRALRRPRAVALIYVGGRHRRLRGAAAGRPSPSWRWHGGRGIVRGTSAPPRRPQHPPARRADPERRPVARPRPDASRQPGADRHQPPQPACPARSPTRRRTSSSSTSRTPSATPSSPLSRRPAPGGTLQTVPMLRGRIVAVNGRPAAEIRGEGSSWALRGDRGRHLFGDRAATIPRLVGGRVVAGRLRRRAARLAGRRDRRRPRLDDRRSRSPSTCSAATSPRGSPTSRSLEWESLSINFVLVFSPNTFAGAPHSHLATLRLAADAAPDADRADASPAITRCVSGRDQRSASATPSTR